MATSISKLEKGILTTYVGFIMSGLGSSHFLWQRHLAVMSLPYVEFVNGPNITTGFYGALFFAAFVVLFAASFIEILVAIMRAKKLGKASHTFILLIGVVLSALLAIIIAYIFACSQTTGLLKESDATMGVFMTSMCVGSILSVILYLVSIIRGHQYQP